MFLAPWSEFFQTFSPPHRSGYNFTSPTKFLSDVLLYTGFVVSVFTSFRIEFGKIQNFLFTQYLKLKLHKSVIFFHKTS